MGIVTELVVEVEVVAGSSLAVVLVKHGDKSWSREFDLLSGDVDDLAEDLEDRMSRELQGESSMAFLLRRRILEAKVKIGGGKGGTQS